MNKRWIQALDFKCDFDVNDKYFNIMKDQKELFHIINNRIFDIFKRKANC